MSDIREVTNPHDKITIDYTDKDAARLAVILVGKGRYGIDGDDGLPIFLLGGGVEWIKATYGKTPDDWFASIPAERVIKALESFANVGEVSSMSDVVKFAHNYAASWRKVVQ